MPLSPPMPPAPVSSWGFSVTKQAKFFWEKCFATKLDPSEVAIVDLPLSFHLLHFARDVLSGQIGRRQQICWWFTFPFLGDIIGLEGDEACRVNDDVEALPKGRLLGTEYLDALLAALLADILNVGHRPIREGHILADVFGWWGVCFEEFLDSKLHSRVDGHVPLGGRHVNAEHGVGACNA